MTKMKNASPLQDKEVKRYIQLSQEGDENARSILVEKKYPASMVSCATIFKSGV